MIPACLYSQLVKYFHCVAVHGKYLKYCVLVAEQSVAVREGISDSPESPCWIGVNVHVFFQGRVAFHVILGRTCTCQVLVIILRLASAVGIDFVGVDVLPAVSHYGLFEAGGRNGGERRWLTFSVFIECESWKVYVVVIAAGETEDAQEYQQDASELFRVHDG